MATDLSPEQRQALDAAHGAPIEIIDARSNEHFVLIRVEVYERLKSILDFSEPTQEEKTAQLQAWGKRAGWEDPEASAFDELKPR
jgi:hypothetical protein